MLRDRTFAALCALILVNQLGFGLITPVLPSFARSFGLDASSIGLVIGIYGFARVLANVPAGQLAERGGRRKVLIIGTIITSVSSALMATATDLPQLLLYRLLSGLGAATVLTGGQIMVGDIAPPATRGRMMSLYQGFFLVGVGLGPTPGGILADHFGLRAPFIAYAVFSALACGVALLLIRETRPEPGARREAEHSTTDAPPASMAATMLTPAFLLIGVVSFAQFFARTGAIFTVIPLLGKEQIGLTASQIGIVMSTVSLLTIATLYHSGLWSDRFGRKRVIAPSAIVCGIGIAMFAFSSSYVMFFASAVFWGLGSGIGGPAPAAYVADLSPAALRGQMFGAFRSLSDCGYIAGPLLLGWMTDQYGFVPPLLLTAAMFISSGVLFWILAPEYHDAKRAAAATTA